MAFAPRLVDNNAPFNTQLTSFPSSRYMGSKNAILPFIHKSLNELDFTTALDACSGSGSVSYLLKSMGKAVTSNDALRFCFHTAQACIANSSERLTTEEVEQLLQPHPEPADFIERTFGELYFTHNENKFLDNLVANIQQISSINKRSLAFAAITRACLRRRPRGIFTYTGLRYEDGRRDLQISLEQHFRNAVTIFNNAVFDNGQHNTAYNSDIFLLPEYTHYDLVYIDPPYVSPHSDNDYSRRYHFVEGLTRYWQDVELLEHTKTKKFRRLTSPFDTKKTIYDAFHRLFTQFQDSILVVSYSSNGIPSKEELFAMLLHYKQNVTVFECDHRYSFGTHHHKVNDNQNEVKEYLFVGR